MKLNLNVVAILLLIQLCGCATRQSFSEAGARYDVTWLDGRVSKIECHSEKLPDGVVFVGVHRSRESETVLIGDGSQKVWMKSTFKPRAETISVSDSPSEGSPDIVFNDSSKKEGSDRLEIREWKLKNDGLSIYSEITVKDDQSGAFKRMEFFGPLGVALTPPK